MFSKHSVSEFNGIKSKLRAFRVVGFNIRDGFIHFNEGEQNQSCYKENNQGEDGGTQASEHLIGEAEDERSNPRGAAFADFVEGVVFGFFAFGNHLGEEAATDGLRASHNEGDEDAENEELDGNVFAVKTKIGVDYHA